MDHYGTLEDATAYHAARGNAAWDIPAKSDSQKIAALIRASSVVDGAYGDRFGGTKTGGRLQALAWPRTDAKDHCANEPIPNNEIPTAVINATYELALVELNRPGSTAPVVTPGRITRTERVDSISREFFGQGGTINVESMRPVLLAVEDALRCILVPKNTTQHILRV